VTPAQCRAARALVNMSLNDLATKAVVPPAMIWDLEAAIAALSERNALQRGRLSEPVSSLSRVGKTSPRHIADSHSRIRTFLGAWSFSDTRGDESLQESLRVSLSVAYRGVGMRRSFTRLFVLVDDPTKPALAIWVFLNLE
jgi:hypothetical protein